MGNWCRFEVEDLLSLGLGWSVFHVYSFVFMDEDEEILVSVKFKIQIKKKIRFFANIFFSETILRRKMCDQSM